jgi:drug/metabolite transporter (DMT)-like permease
MTPDTPPTPAIGTVSHAAPQQALAAAAIIGSALLFTVMVTLIKHLNNSVPLEWVVFARNAVSLALLCVWLMPGGTAAFATSQPRLHAMRALFGLSAMYCLFYVVTQLPLAEATLLSQTAPLYVPFIAALWLGETLGRRLVLATLIGFTGVACILHPSASAFANHAAAVGLFGGFLTALAFVSLRRMAKTEPVLRTVFYFSAFATAVSAIPLALHWSMPPPSAWLTLLGIGAAGSVGQALLTKGYALAPAARVGPFTYSNVVFATLAGWLLWQEVPDALSFAGATLIFFSAVLVFRGRTRTTS